MMYSDPDDTAPASRNVPMTAGLIVLAAIAALIVIRITFEKGE